MPCSSIMITSRSSEVQCCEILVGKVNRITTSMKRLAVIKGIKKLIFQYGMYFQMWAFLIWSTKYQNELNVTCWLTSILPSRLLFDFMVEWKVSTVGNLLLEINFSKLQF